jgi:hypothetical protein
MISRRRGGCVATKTPLSFLRIQQTSEGVFKVLGRRMHVPGRKVETVNFGVVADTTFKQIPVDLVDVCVTNSSFSKSKKKRPGDQGMLITDGGQNVVSAS